MAAKSTAEKLATKPSARVWAMPTDRAALLGPLPEGAHRVDRPDDATVAITFADDAAAIRESLAQHGAHQPPVAAQDTATG